MGNSKIVTEDMAHAAVREIFAGRGTEDIGNLLRAVADRADCVLVPRSVLRLMLEHLDEWFRPPERQAVLEPVREALGE